jgi:hypothetical protein
MALPRVHRRCYDARSPKAPAMNPTRHTTARSASRAAWPLVLGIGGVAGKRLSGNAPARI